MRMNRSMGRICPVCGRVYTEPPALSRRDNATDICPDCGMMEALAAMPGGGRGLWNALGGPSRPQATGGRLKASTPPTADRGWG